MIHDMISKLKAPLDTSIPYPFTLRFYREGTDHMYTSKIWQNRINYSHHTWYIIINSFIFYPSILMIFVSSALFQYAASLCSKRSFQNFNSSFYPRVIILSHLRLTLALL